MRPKGKRGFGAVAGVVSTLTLVVILFVVLNIANSQSAEIVDDLRTDLITDGDHPVPENCTASVSTGCGYAYNISVDGLVTQDNIGSKTGTLSTIIMVAAVITVLLVAFGAFMKRQM